jgi:hypothetical protein
MAAQTFTITNTTGAAITLQRLVFSTPTGLQHSANLTAFQGGVGDFRSEVFETSTPVPAGGTISFALDFLYVSGVAGSRTGAVLVFASGGLTAAMKTTVTVGGDVPMPPPVAPTPVPVAPSPAPSPAPSSNFIMGINAGGPDYTDSQGNLYRSDIHFNGGTGVSSPLGFDNDVDIIDTIDDTLYRSERWGTFSYTIPVSNATYDVIIKLAEIYSGITNENPRIFTVRINDQPVFLNINLLDQVGYTRALDLLAEGISVTNNQILIEFVKEVEEPKVSAIAVYSNSGSYQPPPPPPPVAPSPPPPPVAPAPTASPTINQVIDDMGITLSSPLTSSSLLRLKNGSGLYNSYAGGAAQTKITSAQSITGALAGHNQYMVNNFSANVQFLTVNALDGHTSTNACVEVRRGFAMVLKADNTWEVAYINAPFRGKRLYNGDLSFDRPGTQTQLSGGILRIQPGPALAITDESADQQARAGYELWPSSWDNTPGLVNFYGKIDRNLFAQARCFFLGAQLRLALWDTNRPDDRAQSFFVAQTGFDSYALPYPGARYITDAGVITNAFGGGYPYGAFDGSFSRWKPITSNDWQWLFCMTVGDIAAYRADLLPPWGNYTTKYPWNTAPTYSLTEAQLRDNPPPLNLL